MCIRDRCNQRSGAGILSNSINSWHCALLSVLCCLQIKIQNDFYIIYLFISKTVATIKLFLIFLHCKYSLYRNVAIAIYIHNTIVYMFPDSKARSVNIYLHVTSRSAFSVLLQSNS